MDDLTLQLRTGKTPYWIRLREVLSAKGLDINTLILIDSFEDGENIEYGIVETRDGIRYEFDFGWEEDISKGYIFRWNIKK